MTKPTTLTARTPADLLAIVPIVLGFHPEDSIVMLTFDSPGETFHARVDLPGPDLRRSEERAQVLEAVAPLLQAAVRNRVRRVAFVLYTTHAELAGRVAAVLGRKFVKAGLDIATIFRADGTQWFLDPSRRIGRPYDLGNHPFSAQAVFDGAVTHRSRAALAESLAPLTTAVARVAEALPAALGRLSELDRQGEETWVVETVYGAVEGACPLEVEDVARLVVAVTDVGLRDLAWAQMQRDNAGGHVGLWTDVLRRTPAELVATPACLLAFAAWLDGHGALAWCALDRCLEVDPDYSLAAYIAVALENAIPPSTWDPIEPAAAASRD